jgi:hypothetical protein
MALLSVSELTEMTTDVAAGRGCPSLNADRLTAKTQNEIQKVKAGKSDIIACRLYGGQ